jgi:hypothetical protein
VYHLSPRPHSVFLSPVTYPSTPSDMWNYNEDSYLITTSFGFNKLSIDDTNQDNHNQLLLQDLQSSSKDGKKNILCFFKIIFLLS